MENLFEVILFIIFMLLGVLHFYWVFGGKWALDTAIPTDEKGEMLFKPGKMATLVVALGLFLFGLFYLSVGGFISVSLPGRLSGYTEWIIPGIFLLRAMGDFKYSGLFKKVNQTKFGKKDTLIFTPLCIIIGVLGLLIVLL